MIRFTVVWDPDVQLAFTNAWLASDSKTRRILTDIANWMDTYLAENADVKGRPLPQLSARTIDVPLSSSRARVSVTYQVSPDDRQVRVIQLVFRVS
jgi:hypothetical protein